MRAGAWAAGSVVVLSIFSGLGAPSVDPPGRLGGVGLAQPGRSDSPSPSGSTAGRIVADGLRFAAVQEQAGLKFTHTHGGSGNYYIVESIGSGVAAVDYDGDGWLDVYAVQSTPLPGTAAPTRPFRNALFRNDGRGGFEDVLESRMLRARPELAAADMGYGMGVTAGDFDADGFVDLYVTNWGGNLLFRNNGDGTFVDSTATAGVGDDRWGVSATWADFTGNGLLDLFVVNYLDANFENHQTCKYGPDQIESYCGPAVFSGVGDVLYRNEGDGTFTDISSEAGVVNAEEGKGLAVHALDDDGDGDLDLFVANDTRRNFLYRNDGTGRFEEMGLILGVGYSSAGRAQAGMGVEWNYLDSDNRPDLLVAHFQDDYNTFYRNTGDFYIDETGAAGLRGPTLGYLAFGVVAFDPDLDGDLDVFFANGHIYDVVERYDPRQPHAQTNQLFRNDGSGNFEEISAEAGPALSVPRVSRGAAGADLDNDGDTDLLVSNNDAEIELLANGGYGTHEEIVEDWQPLSPDSASRVAASGNSASVSSTRAVRSITVRLVGRVSPRGGTGARMICEVGGRRLYRYGRTASSYLSQGDPRLRCGLGDADTARVTIEWPSGTVDKLPDIEAGTIIVATEGRGITARTTLPARGR